MGGERRGRRAAWAERGYGSEAMSTGRDYCKFYLRSSDYTLNLFVVFVTNIFIGITFFQE